MRSFACFFTRRLFQAILLSLIASSTVGFAEADLQVSAYRTAAGATIRFVDAATGFSVAPDEVIHSLDKISENVSVRAEGYRPFHATIPTGGQSKRIQFVLEPLVRPEPLRFESIDARRQQDATLFLGYVADDEFGGPLSGVRVESFPSGVVTETDENGFFALAVPLQSEEEAAVSPAGLLFKKNGYDLEEIRGIELFPYGDWTYRIRLRRGDGIRVTDEGLLRRRESPHFSPEEAASTPAPVLSGARISAAADPRSTSTSVETISVPTNIRVLLADGETIEYVPMELYVRRSLPSEWIASWGNYSGGEHSLRAGAVAIRTYAIGFVKNPRDAQYDICGTAVCQVYGSRENSLTDAAVNATSYYVMVNSSGRITFKLTEYSAENNSLGFSCGDGFTSPTGGCLADPVCAGQERYGHGRGLCQWGTARWATGRRMHERRTGDATPHGYPTKNWIELLHHYYPDLTLVQGAPLSTGDTVRVVGNGSRAVRLCAGGGIENGENCPLIATKNAGATGIIVDGPQLVAADGFGYTWWKIKWDDAEGTTGWTAENWLERIVPPPSAPVGLSAVALSSTEIELSWNSSGGSVSGFRVERSAGGGSWSGIDTVSADARTYFDSDLQPVSDYSYRIRAFNSGGNSLPSNVVTITTPDFPPTLDPIADQTIDVGDLLSFAVNSTAPERVFRITDFEQFGNGTPSGTVLFRAPSFSGSTDPLLDSSPNISSVRSDFPAGNESTRALYVAWSWAEVSNPWLRLTTSNVASFGNPVIDFTKRFRFRIHTDRDLKIALGLRETNTRAGTTLGSNGGSNGGIEFVGASGKTGAAPVPVRTIAGGSWTVVEFDLPNEPVVNYANGNGVLESSTGLGVLEHLAFVPADGSGKYEIYL
ncbi:MAG TPA: SpoIID/LytB domain-containing protein, partial [Opitutales bacterium]|nr:SpoIID/LytB domain-containing protein [Opitutales bacterium]